MMGEPLIEIKGIKNFLGGQWVHEGIDLTIYRGEVLAIVGGSGCGKTTLLRSILMLQKPTAGSIHLFGTDVTCCDEEAAASVRKRWGMLFQQGALFSALTVAENIMFPLKEFTELPHDFLRELAMLKIAFVGLPASVADKYPAQLSGGMQKRAAAARAIALDPELLFLDEPTSGLDPRSAHDFDQLVLFLREQLGLTIVLVSHDKASIKRVSDRVAFLGEGRLLSASPWTEMIKHEHPMIVDYFSV